MSAPADASPAPPPSSLPINKDKGALTMLVKPAAPGADLAALAAQIRGLEVRGVRWAQQFGVEGVGYGIDELTVTAFVPPDQTTDAGALARRGEARRGEAGTTTATARGRSRPRDATSSARARGRTRGRALRGRALTHSQASSRRLRAAWAAPSPQCSRPPVHARPLPARSHGRRARPQEPDGPPRERQERR